MSWMVRRNRITMKSFLPQFWELFNSEDSEAKVSERNGAYKGLPDEALYTSYEDLERIFSHHLCTGTFVDLGSGKGQSALLYGHLYPERKAIGIEFEGPRVKIGLNIAHKFSFSNVSLIHADLLSAEIPKADTYFLYFPTGEVLDRILEVLYQRSKFFHLIAIESHGDLLARLDLENWLTLKAEIPLSSKRHYASARIYERNFSIRATSLLPFNHSFKDNYLLISDHGEDWIGDSRGMEWTEGERFELKYPPRTIFWRNVKKLMVFDELSHEVKKLVILRRQGTLTIRTCSREFNGLIRKIILSPTFVIEISTGEKVEWKDIVTIT